MDISWSKGVWARLISDLWFVWAGYAGTKGLPTAAIRPPEAPFLLYWLCTLIFPCCRDCTGGGKLGEVESVARPFLCSSYSHRGHAGQPWQPQDTEAQVASSESLCQAQHRHRGELGLLSQKEVNLHITSEFDPVFESHCPERLLECDSFYLNSPQQNGLQFKQ